MKNISTYIGELLFTHDCVILAELGGFVANLKPASIDHLQHKMIPPTKQITFNTHLSTNDGLLADYIVKKEAVDYNEAMQRIHEFVSDIKNALIKKEPFLIDKVGVLYADENEKTRFEPDTLVNYSIDAFGLTSFHALPVIKKELDQDIQPSKVEIQLEEQREVIPISHPIQDSENGLSKKWKRIAIAAIALPFIAYMSWIPAGSGVFKDGKKIQTSDFNPFQNKTCEVYQERVEHFVPVNLLSKRLTIESIRNVKGKYATVSLLDESDEGFNEEDKLVVDLTGPLLFKSAKSEGVIENSSFPSKGNIKIIAGCFSVRENAQSYMNQLRNKGYDASIVDVRNGLIRVSAGTFPSKQQASEALSQFKLKENSSAWMLY